MGISYFAAQYINKIKSTTKANVINTKIDLIILFLVASLSLDQLLIIKNNPIVITKPIKMNFIF